MSLGAWPDPNREVRKGNWAGEGRERRLPALRQGNFEETARHSSRSALETLKKRESEAQGEAPEEGDSGAISTKVMAEGKEMEEVSGGDDSRVKGRGHARRNVTVTG